MATIKFAVLDRWTGETKFEADIACAKNAPLWAKTALAIEWALGAGADLYNADVIGADFADTDLHVARNDLWDVLLRAPREVSGVLAAIRAGKIDGSIYQGDCACLVGTIANVRGVLFTELGNGLFPNVRRPVESLCQAIVEGDTPATHPVAAIVEGWIVEFQSLQAGG